MLVPCAFYDRCGPAREVLLIGQMPARTPERGEVRVRLHHSGVNPADTKSRAGAPGRAKAFERIVPHHDGAGIVEEVGEEVPGSLVGQPVWIFCGQYERPFGTASQSITIRRELIAPLPSSTSLEIGACLGIPAMTAWNAVLGSRPVTNRTVLVTGGAGAVGHYAVQIARWHGAFVIATVSSDRKAQDARDAGAHHVVNYRERNVAEQILALTDGRGVDLMVDVDTTGNAPLAASVIAMNGEIASYGSSGLAADIPVRDLRLRCASIRFLTIYRFAPDVLQTMAAGINAMLESGVLKHRIAHRYPLNEIAAAHEAVEAGAIGKVLIDIQ